VLYTVRVIAFSVEGPFTSGHGVYRYKYLGIYLCTQILRPLESKNHCCALFCEAEARYCENEAKRIVRLGQSTVTTVVVYLLFTCITQTLCSVQ